MLFSMIIFIMPLLRIANAILVNHTHANFSAARKFAVIIRNLDKSAPIVFFILKYKFLVNPRLHFDKKIIL